MTVLWEGDAGEGDTINVDLKSFHTFVIANDDYPIILPACFLYGSALFGSGADAVSSTGFRFAYVRIGVSGKSLHIEAACYIPLRYSSENGAKANFRITHIYGVTK